VPTEWEHHVKIAKNAGLSDADIAAAQSGLAADEFDRTVLDAVDELDEKSNLSDHTWASLRAARRTPADGPRLHRRRLHRTRDGP
jgi:hypothetical protein